MSLSERCDNHGITRFETELFLSGNNTGIEVPPDLVEALGAGRRPPVVVIVNGFEYRSTIAVMGGKYLIPFSSDKRAATGLHGGDPITVDLELDTAPRTVDVPDDLSAALDAAGARVAFDALAPSARKAHATNVEGAKAAETRERRIAAIVAKLSA
ncbi:YdeI/OmpD-associated family protein [Microbacterium invictum]|uniref:DUF1905 domain-containing protein n=1 Tax=Microbacterium invictum TaxID=515415 RepID=A0AA40SS60_9MICO|nr:YdeI/OmpD-associated family protein [Microbacterium invictum]MBB4141455.1 hypothetical protein [Microbacterium invictum]